MFTLSGSFMKFPDPLYFWGIQRSTIINPYPTNVENKVSS